MMDTDQDKQNRYIEILQKSQEEEQIKRMQLQNDYGQMSSFPPNKDQNLIEYQLDLKEEIDRIHHLLSGHVLEKDNDGNEIWNNPKDDRLKILSEYGVKQIMNLISFYINRNTLLSNYDNETILWKVKDFGNELNDLILCRYESFFYYPTPEDLYDVMSDVIKKNQDKFQDFIIEDDNGNMVIDELLLYDKCLTWSKEELQQKLRHLPMIILSLVDSVHSTYLRALSGMERKSLREMTHISQNMNPSNSMNDMSKQSSMFKPSTWGKG